MRSQTPEIPHTQTASGKIALRLPKSLHRRAVLLAAREGVSLNQWLMAAIAENIGARKAALVEEELRTQKPCLS